MSSCCFLEVLFFIYKVIFQYPRARGFLTEYIGKLISQLQLQKA